MTPEQRDKLEALVRTATPGERKWFRGKNYPISLDDSNGNTIIGAEEYAGYAWLQGDNEHDFEFIRACSPETILSLLADIRAARDEALDEAAAVARIKFNHMGARAQSEFEVGNNPSEWERAEKVASEIEEAIRALKSTAKEPG